MASSDPAKTGRLRAVVAFTIGHWARQKGLVVGILLAVSGATLADVLMPVFAGRLIDALAADLPRQAARQSAMAALGAMVALGAILIALRQVSFLGIIRLTLRMMSDIAREAFAHAQRLSSEWQANTFAGSTVRRISRGMWAIDTLNDTVLVALFPSAVVLLASTVLLGLRWPIMGAVVGLGAVVYVAAALSLSLGYVAPAARLSNLWDSRITGVLSDAIGANGVVKSFGAEMREDALLAAMLRRWRRRTRRLWVRGTHNGTIQASLLLGLRTAVVGLGLWLWWGGRATAGDVTYVLTTYFVVHGYLRDIGQHIATAQRSVNDMDELVALQAEPPSVRDDPGAPPLRIEAGAIAFRRVAFHYGAHARPLYRDLSVDIPAGERIGLVGRSGSGKTTFVKLIQRLYDVTGGCIRIDGQDIARVSQASLRQQVAVVQQEPVLFHRSLAENIAYGRPGASRAAIEHAARLANAHGFIERLPKAYATLVGERGVKLSGGERQRVALARAFLADAPILVLDEATSSLDAESEAMIQEAIARLLRGRTSLVIAHRLSTVRELDRILVFEAGRIVDDGDHAALLAREGVYRMLFERQAGGLAEAGER